MDPKQINALRVSSGIQVYSSAFLPSLPSSLSRARAPAARRARAQVGWKVNQSPVNAKSLIWHGKEPVRARRARRCAARTPRGPWQNAPLPPCARRGRLAAPGGRRAALLPGRAAGAGRQEGACAALARRCPRRLRGLRARRGTPAPRSQVTIYPFPKARAEAFGLPRKAVPSFVVKGPATPREIFKLIHETLSTKLTTKQLRSFPKDKAEDAKEGSWMDLIGDMGAFDGFVEELIGSNEIDVKYVSTK